MDSPILLTILQALALNKAYDFTCPSQSHWKIRAKSICLHSRNYTCLFDVTFRAIIYREKCNGPRILEPGYKYVFQPNFNKATCSVNRYQPFIFDTIGYSDCTFSKSLCNSEGLTTYKNGSTTSDRTCICNNNKGYVYVNNPNSKCFCNPLNEDCSCYIDIYSSNKRVGSKDMKCFDNMKQIRIRPADELNKPLAIKIIDFDNYRYNLDDLPTDQYRTNTFISVLILVSLYLIIAAFLLKNMQVYQQATWTKTDHVVNQGNEVLPDNTEHLSRENTVLYDELLQSSENEKRYFVRMMIVGKENVGKTCLLRRLLKDSIDDVSSTDGIDIVVHRCKINIENGAWTIGKGLSDDYVDRIQRAAIDNQILKNEDSETESTENNKNKSLCNDTKASDKTVDNTREAKNSTFVFNSNIDDPTANDEDTKMNSVSGGENDDISTSENRNSESKKEKNETLVMPVDLISEVFSTPKSNSSSNVYALCGLWDFAGQKEFYATHQAFLTNSAIYVVVADMADDIHKQDIKQCFADYQNVGGYVDFWFDTIHCHRTTVLPANEHINYAINPAVILVFTGKDKYDKVDLKKRKRTLVKQIHDVFGMQSKYHHLQNTFYVSNTNDPDKKFEKLRKAISATAKKMNNWGELLPFKWILLEHLIQLNKADGKHFIFLTDVVNLAQHKDINMTNTEEVSLFLCFQHKVGNVIFFKDIPDLIILNPQWLVDAFRCLVSDKIDDKLQHWEDTTQFLRSGKLSYLLITELFRAKSESQFLRQKDDLLKIMEKFDILVKVEDTLQYIVPSMMPSLSFEEVCDKIGVRKQNCKRSSWFCLKFAFLPPAFFNHFSVWFIKHFKPSRIDNEIETLALFRGVCILDTDTSGCEKLLLTMSTNTIALQILSFSEQKKEFGEMCSFIRKEIIKKTEAIKERYKLKILYEIHFKCSTGHYHKDTISYNDLKSASEYFCPQHKEVHQSELIYLPWMTNAYEFSKDEINYLRLVSLLQIAEDAVRFIFDDEFKPSILGNWLKENHHRLEDLCKKKILTRIQWRLICSTNDVSSKNFDLMLMLRLLDTFTNLTISKNIRFATGVSRDLSMILDFRTKIVNNINGTLGESDFYSLWNGLSQAIGGLSNENYAPKCLRIQNCRLDDVNKVSLEDINYIRIVHFIYHVATKVVRTCFDMKLDSTALGEIRNSKNWLLQKLGIEKKCISDQQWELLFQCKEGNVSSTSLDIKTMIILMKNIKGVQYDSRLLGEKSNTWYLADLSQLLCYREEISTLKKITMDQFEERWFDISGALVRLGGDRFINVCSELKTTPLYSS